MGRIRVPRGARFPLPSRIAGRRFEMGLTIREAAARVRSAGVRCSASAFAAWESGRNRPPPAAWGPLACALSTTVGRLGGRFSKSPRTMKGNHDRQRP
jgi:hypothetical protein